MLVMRVVINFKIMKPPNTGHSKYWTSTNSGQKPDCGMIYYEILMKKPSGSGQS